MKSETRRDLEDQLETMWNVLPILHTPGAYSLGQVSSARRRATDAVINILETVSMECALKEAR